ncbi:MAG TPA: 2-hydroxyacyl-CoA dehydratase family protein [Anaerolineae bacterium]|nr:2-hydroxyacyl-CoA dehydratase family protein [Anaerolineae bacterium]
MPPETLPTSHTVDDVQFAICNLQSAICNLQSKGNPQSTFGFLTAYVPEELFHAAGFTPVFIFHTPDDEGHARAHLPGFTCWVAGSALDQALAGRLDGLAGMALAQTCDTMQGLTDIWRRNVAHIPLFHFGMPLRLDSPSARVYLLAELRSLREHIQALTGRRVVDDALRGSIALYNRTRALVRRLYARAADFAPPDLYALVRAAFQTPKETYNDHVAWLLEQPTIPPGREAQGSSPRVLLVGCGLADPVLFDVVAQAGGRVAGDLLDLGERYFDANVAGDSPQAHGQADSDPLETLADRLLALVPTPTKYHAQSSRAAHLLSLVRERHADGVIFARQKFCDPHGFDYVLMAQALDRAGVPHLLVELEQASQAGQLRTRVEAFMEMLP